VPAGILVCQAEPDSVRRRLEMRRGDASDADWAVYLQVAANWEDLGGRSQRVSHAVSTEGSPEQTIDRALQELRQLGLYE
jgi:predicted kinase